MTALELISDTVPAVKGSDKVSLALDWMAEFKVNQLPLIHKGKYAGLISENQLLDAADSETKIGEIVPIGSDRLQIPSQQICIRSNQHYYEAIGKIGQFKLDLLPVVDDNQVYLGVITSREIISHLGNLFAVREPGSIVILEVGQHDYSLSEVGRIVESTDAKVLSLYLQEIPDSPRLVISMKINAENPARVIAAFERFKYTVLMSYFKAEEDGDYRKNLDALLRMLD